MTGPLANWYSSESTQREPSNEYQQERVYMVFYNLRVLVRWKKVTSALEGLTTPMEAFENHLTPGDIEIG